MTETYDSATDRAPAEDEASLREALTDEPAPLRRDAALALASTAARGLDTATATALAERVRTDDDPDVRQFAVEALGVADRRPDAVRDALADDHEWVRSEAVVAYSRIAPADTDPLERVLDEDDSGWVRRNAVVALGKRQALEQDALVDRIKTDPHPPVREYAAQFLADAVSDVDVAERILAAVLAREPNAFVRAKAAESLGQLGTARAQEALESHGVPDRSDDVARTAERALADARGVDPDDLDVDADVPDPDAPGTGPDAPQGRGLGGGPDGTRRQRPGGAPGFDPEEHLDGGLDDRP
ncbi:HEAT repeat domain-containing protein [Halorubellus sp. PRR65]|uniref:HEAT repeat domain-containing protein n=1 Tax=Halorubellus sp. PRR65 TaxID=3098148 RepID=UPI002B25AE06|nr:HEAT repeat domain-containing protein [Halorubellus sp. PRR65]